MSDNSLSNGAGAIKSNFGGQYQSPAVRRPTPHSWADEVLELQAELRECQRRLQEARVDGDRSKIREAEIEEVLAREQYQAAVHRCGAEHMFGMSCAIHMGRDPGLPMESMVDELLRRAVKRITEGGPK